MIIFSAFFSGMEIAFVAANKFRLELEKKQAHTSAKILSVFLKKPGEYITTMLIGNNIALVIYGIAMAKILDPVIGVYIQSTFAVFILQTIISTLIILITAEFIPKAFFRLHPNDSLNVFAIPVRFFHFIFYPVTRFTMWITNTLLSKVMNLSMDNQQEVVFGKIDLTNYMDELQVPEQKEEEIEPEVKIFKNAMDFSNIRIRECLVPRPEIEAVAVDDDIEVLKEKFIETGFSKILIYRDSIDDIIGYFHSADLFKNPKSIHLKINEIMVVPMTMPANKLLSIFTKEKKSIAVVVDEFGGTAGIVTLEDIIEEIFGEIEDEHDTVEWIEEVIKPNEYRFSARHEIDYLNEKYKLDIPVSDEYETIAGFILFHHENIPNINDKIKIGSFIFTIEKASETRIKTVKLTISVQE